MGPEVMGGTTWASVGALTLAANLSWLFPSPNLGEACRQEAHTASSVPHHPPHSTRGTWSGARVFALRSTLAFLPPWLGFSGLLGIPVEYGVEGGGACRVWANALFLD